MKGRTLAVLFVVAIALGAFIWFFERELPSTEERAEVAKRVLGSLELEAVRAVTLEHDGQRVELSRVDLPDDSDGSDQTTEVAESGPAVWRIEQPLAARADTTAVEALLRRLTEAEHRRVFESGARSDFGLEAPARRISLTTEDGAEVVLEIGDDAPVGEGVYVAVAGSGTLYLVDSTVTSDLDRAPGDWRDRQLLAAGTAQALRASKLGSFSNLRSDVASVSSLATGVLLVKRDETFWLEAPHRDRADDELVASLFTTLSGARVEAFVDDPPPLAEIGLDPVVAGLEIVPEGEDAVIRVEWGAPTGPEGGRFWARVDGQVVETNAALGEILARPAEAWRSRAWTTSKSFEIDRVTAADGETTFEVRRAENGSDWTRRPAGAGEVGAEESVVEENIGYAAVADLLYAVTSARATDVVDKGTVALSATPDISLTLASNDDTKIEGLQLYQVGEDWWGPAPGREALLRFAPDWVAELQAKIAAVSLAEAEVTQDAEDAEAAADLEDEHQH